MCCADVLQGRQMASLVLEHYELGFKKALWISTSADLKHDSERDLRDIGAEYIPLHSLKKLKYNSLNEDELEGVLFVTYSNLIAKNHRHETRLDEILEWCGSDFEGLIIFDECHKV